MGGDGSRRLGLGSGGRYFQFRSDFPVFWSKTTHRIPTIEPPFGSVDLKHLKPGESYKSRLT